MCDSPPGPELERLRKAEQDAIAEAANLRANLDVAVNEKRRAEAEAARYREAIEGGSGGMISVEAGCDLLSFSAGYSACQSGICRRAGLSAKPAPSPPPATMLICLTCRRAITANDEQGRRTHSCKQPRWAQYEVTPDAALPPGPSGVGSATGANPTAPAPKPPPLVAWVCKKCGETFAGGLGASPAVTPATCYRITGYNSVRKAPEFCAGELVRCVEEREEAK